MVGSKNPSPGCPGPHGQESPDLQNVIASWPLSPAVAEGLEDRRATTSVGFSPCSPRFPAPGHGLQARLEPLAGSRARAGLLVLRFLFTKLRPNVKQIKEVPLEPMGLISLTHSIHHLAPCPCRGAASSLWALLGRSQSSGPRGRHTALGQGTSWKHEVPPGLDKIQRGPPDQEMQTWSRDPGEATADDTHVLAFSPG